MIIIMKIELLKYSNHYRRRMAALKVLPESCKELREAMDRKRNKLSNNRGMQHES